MTTATETPSADAMAESDATAEAKEPDAPATADLNRLKTAPDAQDLAQAALKAAVEADPNLERATVTLPTTALTWLREEANKRGITTGEMLRTALGTQKFLLEKIAGGAKVQLKDTTGTFDLSF